MSADDLNPSVKTPLLSPENPDPKKERPSRDHKRTTVRFSDEEFERVDEEARMTGKSIPQLLKMSHFRRKKLTLLFDKDDTHRLCGELRRIGNNVNQIARRVNSGALEGWYEEFEKMLKLLSELQQMVVGVYGVR